MPLQFFDPPRMGPVTEAKHLLVAQINEDRTPSSPRFIRIPVESHDPPKYSSRIVLLDFRCVNGNRAF